MEKLQSYYIKKLAENCSEKRIPFLRFEPGQFSQSGIPDCMINIDMQSLFIEIKATGELSGMQKMILKKFGGCCWHPNVPAVMWFGQIKMKNIKKIEEILYAIT